MQTGHHFSMMESHGDAVGSLVDHDDYITLDVLFVNTDDDDNDGCFNHPEDAKFMEAM